MSTTTQKVLAGCAVGCLLVIVLAVGVGWMGYRWVETATEAIENAEQTERALVDSYGRPGDFHPPVEPGLTADRLEVFLAVRDGLAEERTAFADSISALAPGGEDGGGGGFRTARTVAGLPSRIFSFVNARNKALLDHGMGFGEYTWIYWLTYNAWLGHPANESELHEIMKERSDSEGRMQVQFGGPEEDELAWRIRRDVSEMLQNLEADLAADPERGELRALVVEELNALGLDPDRIPWEDGLPEPFADGLEAYRDRLEASYSRATNPFELIDLD